MWEMIFIILALISFICAWIGLFSPKSFQDKKSTEKPAVRGQLFGVFLFLFVVFVGIAAYLVPEVEGGGEVPLAEKTVETAIDAIKEPEPVEVKTEPVETKTLAYDVNTIVKKINSNLKEAGISYVVKLPRSKLEGVDNDVMQVIIKDQWALTFTFPKNTDKPDNLSILFALSGPDKVVEQVYVASLMIAAAVGEGDKSDIADKVLMAFGKVFTEFNQLKVKDDVHERFVSHDVQFEVSIVPGIGIFVSVDGEFSFNSSR